MNATNGSGHVTNRIAIRRKSASMVLLFVFVMAGPVLNGQEVKSEKVSLWINNLPVVPEVEKPAVPDTEPPDIEIISPKIYLGTRYYSTLPEMDIIGKVTDSTGVTLMTVNSEIRPVTDDGMFTMRLTLRPGDNRFNLVAIDPEENLREEFFLVNYAPPSISLADKIVANSTYFGLIIGIDHYRDEEIKPLENPIHDAENLYKVLTERYNFDEENIRFIKDATRGEIIQTLDELAGVITENDNLLIFYAGHGWWDEQSNNGYWLPSDADSRVKTNWFRNSTLVSYLKEIHSRHTLLVTDACFGGSIFNMRSAFGSREKAYEKLYELPSRKAMTSGNLEKVPDRSSFTRFLIQRLEENKETYLSSEQLFSSLRLPVINNSDAIPRFGEIENVGDEGGDFIFLLKPESEAE